MRVQPSFMAAIGLCISSSGLEDTEIVLTLEIDAGHWTRIKRGDAHFPPNKLVPLMELCGNDIPLRWLAMRCGYELPGYLRCDLGGVRAGARVRPGRSAGDAGDRKSVV